MSFFLALTTFFFASNAQTLCDDASECAGSTLTGSLAQCYGYNACTSANIDTTNTQCYGYNACVSADIDSSNSVSCSGLNACNSATIDTLSIICDGEFGCRSATMNSDTTVVCDGEYSCYSSTVNVDTDLYCNGDHACYGGTFTIDNSATTSDIYIGGNRGGSAATIDCQDSSSGQIWVYSYGFWGSSISTTRSGESNTLMVRFGGYLSGYNASVYCESGSTCTVQCYGYGCKNTVLYCDSSATCNTLCTDTPSDAYCVTQTTSSSMANMDEKPILLTPQQLQNLPYPNAQELAHHESLTKDNEQINQDKAKMAAKKPRKSLVDSKVDISTFKKFTSNENVWKVVAVASIGFSIASIGIMCCYTSKYKDYQRI